MITCVTSGLRGSRAEAVGPAELHQQSLNTNDHNNTYHTYTYKYTDKPAEPRLAQKHIN